MSDVTALRLQAEAGDPRAQVRLAHASLLGREAASAPADALRLLDAACEKNYPEALLLRAVLSMMGLATPRNYDDAFRYLSRAAAAGHASAKRQVAVLTDAQGRFNLEIWSAKPEAERRFNAPRLFTFTNFIPKAACDWLIERSRDKMQPAATWDSIHGGEQISAYRSSSVTSLGMLSFDLVSLLINLRIAAATGTPLLNQEPTSILRYEVGQQYRPHFDFIAGAKTEALRGELAAMGQRVGTFLIYLNDDYDGGETDFPRLSWRFSGGKGDAVFFFNVSAQGEPEPLSLHAGAPVTHGEKWLLSKWIRADQVPFWWPSTKTPAR